MDSGTLIALIIGGLTVLLGGIGLYKQIRSTTAADRDRAATRQAEEDRERERRYDQQIRDARQEERDRCAEQVRPVRDALGEMTTDRNSERARADGLQKLINERGLGGKP